VSQSLLSAFVASINHQAITGQWGGVSGVRLASDHPSADRHHTWKWIDSFVFVGLHFSMNSIVVTCNTCCNFQYISGLAECTHTDWKELQRWLKVIDTWFLFAFSEHCRPIPIAHHFR